MEVMRRRLVCCAFLSSAASLATAGDGASIAKLEIALGDETLVFRRIEPGRYGIDYPAYYMLETEVTNAQYKAFLDATGRHKRDGRVVDAVRPTDELVAAARRESGLDQVSSDLERIAARMAEVGEGSAEHAALAKVWWMLRRRADALKVEFPILLRANNRIAGSSDPVFTVRDVEMTWRGDDYPPGRGRHPVALITPADAIAFCEWVGTLAQEYGRCRLPVDDEWAVAAYGDRNYPWGDVWDDAKTHVSIGRRYVRPRESEDAWGVEDAMHRRTVAVDAFPEGRTPEGLFGMAGNVAEMTYVDLSGCWGCTNWMGFNFTSGAMTRYAGTVLYRYDPRQTYFGGAHSPHCRKDTLGFRPVIDPSRADVTGRESFFPDPFEESDEYRQRLEDYERRRRAPSR